VREADDASPPAATVRTPDPADVPDVSVLVVDNYDSFAYNLVQYVGELAGDVAVRRNDAIDVAGIRDLDPDGVVVSPGPGRPADAGVSTAVFEEPDLPVLGVCLGHQALCAANGAAVERAPTVVHGKPSTLVHDGAGLYRDLPERMRVGRYHSLAVDRAELPDTLVETARTVDEERSVLMGVRHRERPHYGVQFHPESILTGEAGAAEAGRGDATATRHAAGDAGVADADLADAGAHDGDAADGDAADAAAASGAGDASLAVGKTLIARFCELVAAAGDGIEPADAGGEPR